MRSPCLMTSRSTRRASGLDRSTRYFSQYRGECASVRIWSSASDSAVRSPRLAASFKSSSSLARLIRDGRARPISASLRRTAAQPDLVAFTVRVVRLNRDLPVERARQPFESFLAVTLEVPRQLGMHAHDDLAVRLEVDLEHGLLEVAFADVLARVHVDRDQRFGVVDDDVPAGLEPDAAPERPLDVLLDPERLENRGGLLPEPHAIPQRRHEDRKSTR